MWPRSFIIPKVSIQMLTLVSSRATSGDSPYMYPRNKGVCFVRSVKVSYRTQTFSSGVSKHRWSFWRVESGFLHSLAIAVFSVRPTDAPSKPQNSRFLTKNASLFYCIRIGADIELINVYGQCIHFVV